MAPDLRKLKDRANEAVEKGKHRKAAELFLELARVEPGWPHRAGELLRKVGENDEAVALLMAAAEGYSKQGFLLKGVAVAKVVSVGAVNLVRSLIVSFGLMPYSLSTM